MPTTDTTTASNGRTVLRELIYAIYTNGSITRGQYENLMRLLNDPNHVVVTIPASTPQPAQTREGDWKKVFDCLPPSGVRVIVRHKDGSEGEDIFLRTDRVTGWEHGSTFPKGGIQAWKHLPKPPPDAQTPQRAEGERVRWFRDKDAHENYWRVDSGGVWFNMGNGRMGRTTRTIEDLGELEEFTPPSPASGGESVGTEWLPEGMYPFDSGNTCAVLYHGDVRERDAQWRAEIARLTKSLADARAGRSDE